MAKGFQDTSDPNVVPGEFTKCPAGTYEVTSTIEWVSRTDKNDPLSFPVFKQDKHRGQVAQLRFSRKDGKSPDPIHAATAADLAMLVKAFGGNPAELPKERYTTEYLINVERLISKSTKTVKVEVKESGWVSFVHGAVPSEGLYQWKLVRASSIDSEEPLHFAKDAYGGESLRLVFEITGNYVGKPTPFDGFQTMITFHNPFDGSENGVPKFKVNENGSKPMTVVRLEKIISALCPEMYEHDWQSADNSPYGVDEADNPMVVIADKAIKNGRSGIAQFLPNKNGKLALDLKTLSPLEMEDIQVEETPATATDDLPFDVELYRIPSEFASEHPELADFAAWIWAKAPKSFVTAPVSKLDELALSDTGKAWANSNLPKILLDAGIKAQAKPINQFTEEECAKINLYIRENLFSKPEEKNEFSFA